MPRKDYPDELVRRSTGRSLEEVLRDLYVNQRYTQQEIADHLGLTRSLVNERLRELGISRADRQPLEPVL